MKSDNAWGLWFGHIKGTNNGSIMLSIDADRLSEGFVCFYDNNPRISSTRAVMSLQRNGQHLKGHSSNIFPFFNTPEQDKSADFIPPTEIHFSAQLKEDWSLEGEWFTDVDTKGSLTLQYNEYNQASPPDHTFNWNQFKDFIHQNAIDNPGAIYRGQSNSEWPLRTTFHRSCRRNLFRYQNEDLAILNKHLAPLLGRKFELENGMDLSELVLLAQHHGYPTPFLDWTSSPYVAAFFGYSLLDKYQVNEGKVRVFIFYGDRWRLSGLSGGRELTDPRPSFNLLDIVTSVNTRVLPQQGLVTFTNLMSIEHFLKFYETQKGVKYLEIIDIDARDRNNVIGDLNLMGINAASLYQGLDATCKTLSERFF